MTGPDSFLISLPSGPLPKAQLQPAELSPSTTQSGRPGWGCRPVQGWCACSRCLVSSWTFNQVTVKLNFLLAYLLGALDYKLCEGRSGVVPASLGACAVASSLGGCRIGEEGAGEEVRICVLEICLPSRSLRPNPFPRRAQGQSPEQLVTLEPSQDERRCSALFPITRLWPFPGPMNKPELEGALNCMELPDYHSWDERGTA